MKVDWEREINKFAFLTYYLGRLSVWEVRMISNSYDIVLYDKNLKKVRFEVIFYLFF